MSQIETPVTMPIDQSGRKMTFASWNQLIKPRIAIMVAFTAYFGYQIGLKDTGASFNWLVLWGTLCGIAISCVSAGIFNQLVERESDRKMARTATRPLATDQLSLTSGIILAIVTGVLGVGLLAASANVLTALLSAFTIVTYAAVYTPLKRVTSVSTIVGAVPGALPPIMGFTAATNAITPMAICIFLILFLWQLPHFLAIAWLYRKQYANAGMPMLPVLDPDGSSTFRQILLGCSGLIPLSILPNLFGLTGMIYFYGAIISGVIFLAFGIALSIGKTDRLARGMFYVSLIYVPVILALMMFDQQ